MALCTINNTQTRHSEADGVEQYALDHVELDETVFDEDARLLVDLLDDAVAVGNPLFDDLLQLVVGELLVLGVLVVQQFVGRICSELVKGFLTLEFGNHCLHVYINAVNAFHSLSDFALFNTFLL